jgi:rRNA-processing protein FCF1
MISFNKKQQHGQHGGMILDTCALIDGRILDIAKAGFVPHNLVIPQFVIAELQYLADNGDSHKRERARFGLDVIRDLQDMRRVNVSIAREQFTNIKEVDDKLIALAKQYGAMLYTTDYNLNKVAQIEGVHVLNVNELAQALRPNRLPGERLELKITQVGQDKTQGVGYLDDGTMVVVERAGNKVGQKVIVEFSRILQTQAGKMMFAVLPERQQSNQPKPQPEQKQVQQPIPQRITPQQKNQPQQQQMSRQSQPTTQQPSSNQRPLRAWHSPRPNRGPRPQQQQQRRSGKNSPEDALLQALQRPENQ